MYRLAADTFQAKASSFVAAPVAHVLAAIPVLIPETLHACMQFNATSKPHEPNFQQPRVTQQQLGTSGLPCMMPHSC